MLSRPRSLLMSISVLRTVAKWVPGSGPGRQYNLPSPRPKSVLMRRARMLTCQKKLRNARQSKVRKLHRMPNRLNSHNARKRRGYMRLIRPKAERNRQDKTHKSPSLVLVRSDLACNWYSPVDPASSNTSLPHTTGRNCPLSCRTRLGTSTR